MSGSQGALPILHVPQGSESPPLQLHAFKNVSYSQRLEPDEVEKLPDGVLPCRQYVGSDVVCTAAPYCRFNHISIQQIRKNTAQVVWQRNRKRKMEPWLETWLLRLCFSPSKLPDTKSYLARPTARSTAAYLQRCPPL